MGVPLAVWAGVLGVLVVLFAIDLAAHRGDREEDLGRATLSSLGWFVAAAAFGGFVWAWRGATWGGQYFAAYLTEKALSVDNLFVFAVILGGLGLTRPARRRVLRWGVVGALAGRAIMIVAGISLLDRFWWASYVLGAFVLASGLRLGWARRGRQADPGLRWTSRLVARAASVDRGEQKRVLVLRRDGKGRHGLRATPLLAALIAVQVADVAFAVDSVPAVLAVTKEPFLVFSSNAFAVLGLRALYFVLDGALGRLRYLHAGLAVILVLVGGRMLTTELWELPVWATLSAIALVLAVTTGASRARPHTSQPTRAAPDLKEGPASPLVREHPIAGPSRRQSKAALS